MISLLQTLATVHDAPPEVTAMSVQQYDISSEQLRQVVARATRGARGDPTVRYTCGTTSTNSPAGESTVVLRVAGELDLATSDFLTTELAAALTQRPNHLIVDLGEVSFCSGRGLAAIADAGVTATKAGARYSVSAASPVMARCWARCWADNEQPTQYPSSAAAVSAAWAHPAHLHSNGDTHLTATNGTSESRQRQRGIDDPELDGWENEGGHLLTKMRLPEHLPSLT